MIDKATEIAVKASTLDSKHLWIKIVKFQIASGMPLEKCLDAVDKKHLRIQDILPHLGDITHIYMIQDVAVTALEDQERELAALSNNLESVSKGADLIRSDMKKIQKGSMVISAMRTCDHCKERLLKRAFYGFGCHYVHIDCMHTLMAVDKVVAIQLKHASLAEVDAIVARDCPYCGNHRIKTIDVEFANLNELPHLVM